MDKILPQPTTTTTTISHDLLEFEMMDEQHEERKDDHDLSLSPMTPEVDAHVVLTDSNIQLKEVEPTTPLSVRRKAIAIYVLIACSAISQTLIEPILPFMVEERMNVHGKNTSLIVGLISSALFLGECCSMSAIGYLSDFYGRKWFLVALQIASFVGCASFGAVTNWYVAFFLRFAQGCFGGIHATSKACLVDISSEHNRSLLLAYIATTYAVARAFSSIFGVSALTIVRKIHHGNAYLITSLIAACIVFAGVVTSVFMEETNKRHRKKEKRNYFADFIAGLKHTYSDRTVATVSGLFCISYFSNAASITLWTLISEADVKNFGLGFSVLGTGLYIGVFGLVCALFQLLVYKRALKKLGLHKMFMIATISAAVDIIMFSVAAFPYWLNGFKKSTFTKMIVVGILCCNTILASVSRTILIPTLNGMIGNLTDLRSQGLVQGSIQTLSNLSKAMGPIVAGTVYYWGERIRFPWLISISVSLLYLLSLAVAYLTLSPAKVEQKNPTAVQNYEESEIKDNKLLGNEFDEEEMSSSGTA